MKEVNSQKIKNVIKELLKEKGLTYDDVAAQLGCSLPTVNRILGSEEISLNRILELCDLLDVTFSDLASMTKEQNLKEDRFTEAQENFLSKNNHLFAYFLKLISGESPKDIAASNNLTQKSTDKYLIALEKQELIKVSGKNKIRPVFKGMPKLGKGALGRAYYEKIISGSGRFFIDHIRKNLQKTEGASNAQFTVNGSKMTSQTYYKLIEEMEVLFSRYRDISDMEEKIKNPKDLKTVVINYGHTILENDDPTLSLLDNLFGEIKNI